jgi:hypothetical protein
MRGRLLLSALAVGVIGAALTVSGVRSPVTGPLTLLFLLLTPAVCVALLLTGLEPLARAIVAGAAALALASAIAEVMLVASAWSPRAGVIVVGIACAVLALTAAVRRRRARSSGASAPDDDEDAWAFDA